MYRVAPSALGQDLVLNTWATNTNVRVINPSYKTYKREICAGLSPTRNISPWLSPGKMVIYILICYVPISSPETG